MLPEQFRQISSPLKLDAWRRGLQGHPDRDFVGYILRGIEKGFRVGFAADLVSLRARNRNMLSATDHAQVVAEYLDREMQEGGW